MAKPKTTHQVLNYRVIIEPEVVKSQTVYNAYCPTLELADYGDTVEAALKSMRSMMKFHIECLIEEGQLVPQPDHPESFVSMTSIKIPLTAGIQYA